MIGDNMDVPLKSECGCEFFIGQPPKFCEQHKVFEQKIIEYQAPKKETPWVENVKADDQVSVKLS